MTNAQDGRRKRDVLCVYARNVLKLVKEKEEKNKHPHTAKKEGKEKSTKEGGITSSW